MRERKCEINQKGVSVRCRLLTAQDTKTYPRIILCTHGFGGSKDVANITRFAEKALAKHKEDAILAFDWPCHGQDAKKKLDLSDCLLYLRLAVSYARGSLGADKVYNYSVSLGGYLTLRFLREEGNPFERIALRAPALRLYDLMRSNVPEADRPKLDKGKDVQIGFERKMKVDTAFFEDLKSHDVRTYEYFDEADRLLVLHGTADQMVPFEDSLAFCEANVIDLVPVEGADHPFRNPKLMDAAIHEIVEFFSE